MKNKRYLVLLVFATSLSACSYPIESGSFNSQKSSSYRYIEPSINSEGKSRELNSSISSSSSSVLSYSSNSLPNSSSSKSSSKPSSSSRPTSSSSSKSSTSMSTSIPDKDNNWNLDFTKRGADFRENLRTEIQRKRTKTTSYNSCLEIGAAAAADPNEPNKFVPIYHPSSDLTTTGSCNREHMWPNSRGSGKTGPGADPYIIRPSLKSENSARGNNFYGSEKSNEWDPASATNYKFEAARGESARVILYAAVSYYKSHGFVLTNNPSDDWNKIHSMGTLKFLIRWNNQYAPTDTEIRINNYLQSQGYGRNPFVDHPEYANFIWDEEGLIGETNSAVSNLNLDYNYESMSLDINRMQNLTNAA